MTARDRWLALVYGSLLVPLAPPRLLALGRSMSCRRQDSVRLLNRHVWIAIGLKACANVARLALRQR